MISRDTIKALCEEAGVDPNYVSSALITQTKVNWTMYSQDKNGDRYVDKKTGWVKTHWMITQIAG